jgi:hypothetical protein
MLGTNAQIFRYIAKVLPCVAADLNHYADSLDPRVMSGAECLGHVLTGHHNQANLGEFDS